MLRRISAGVPDGERAPLVEHVDPIADVHDQRHVVIHEQHACTVLSRTVRTRFDERDDVGLGQSRRGFVEQDIARPRGERTGDPDLLLSPWAGPRPDDPGALLQVERLEQLGAHGRASPRGHPDAQRAELDVLATLSARNRWPCWKVRASPAWARRRACHVVTSSSPSTIRPRGGQVEPGDQVDQRGLPGAVRADQPDHLVALIDRLTPWRACTPSNDAKRRWSKGSLRPPTLARLRPLRQGVRYQGSTPDHPT